MSVHVCVWGCATVADMPTHARSHFERPTHVALHRTHAQAAERADEAVALAAVSAAVLYPVLPGQSTGAEVGSATGSLYNSRALQCWVLRACQQLKGGLRDKPGKPPDYYHTCYCLSGLSSAQHLPGEIISKYCCCCCCCCTRHCLTCLRVAGRMTVRVNYASCAHNRVCRAARAVAHRR